MGKKQNDVVELKINNHVISVVCDQEDTPFEEVLYKISAKGDVILGERDYKPSE